MTNRQDSRRRAEEANRLRAVGRTWDEIADELGYRSRQGAQQAVERLQQRNPLGSAESVRRSASDGLRVVRAVLFERFADAKDRDDNDDLVLLAKELRANISETAKLHGAHVPVKAELDVRVTTSAAEAVNRLEQELLAIAAQRQHNPQFPQIIEGEVIE
ncbi:hypothetical protein [Mycobacterium sp. MS1601]|uniref:hypothetical protein n=1 Tax=Mycobacterium sp. MS1601 TaxID=1936029 RepID=UPI001F250078|nr:hypothetical protein [Mycobacterium sp. MS1601]